MGTVFGISRSMTARRADFAICFSKGMGAAEVATGAPPKEKYAYTALGTMIRPNTNPTRNVFTSVLLLVMNRWYCGARESAASGQVMQVTAFYRPEGQTRKCTGR